MMPSSRWSMLARGAACLVLALTAYLGSSTVRADWNPGDPFKMHYPQLPDLTPTGLDVLATFEPGATTGKILADDWLCTFTGPVSDIHIWGSWLNDLFPLNDPGAVTFKLSIHADIPITPGGFSMPGAELWSAIFTPGSFTTRLYGTGTEGFYDPNLNQIIGTDTMIFQYNFEDIPTPFIQEVGTVYWLDVQALPATVDCLFGWKTTNPIETPHFRDDAVFADTAAFAGPPGPWAPMVYPAGHPFAGQSIDQAFVITTVPEPSTIALAAIGGVGLVGVIRRRRRA